MKNFLSHNSELESIFDTYFGDVKEKVRKKSYKLQKNIDTAIKEDYTTIKSLGEYLSDLGYSIDAWKVVLNDGIIFTPKQEQEIRVGDLLIGYVERGARDLPDVVLLVRVSDDFIFPLDGTFIGTLVSGYRDGFQQQTASALTLQ